jgi:hypothetical protein
MSLLLAQVTANQAVLIAGIALLVWLRRSARGSERLAACYVGAGVAVMNRGPVAAQVRLARAPGRGRGCGRRTWRLPGR